jgi:hypothetical protein
VTQDKVPFAVRTVPPAATATPVPEAPAETPPTPQDADPTQAPAPEPTATAVAPSATPASPTAPTSGRWIDVDVTNYVVKLMDGTTVLREIGPVAVGSAIDNGDYVSTQTGLFAVHTKVADLTYDAPYDTYISHWVGFDSARDNGFHSFLKDAQGNVVDASTGRVSNGCIRSGEAELIFLFAEIGMPVWVHW